MTNSISSQSGWCVCVIYCLCLALCRSCSRSPSSAGQNTPHVSSVSEADGDCGGCVQDCSTLEGGIMLTLQCTFSVHGGTTIGLGGRLIIHAADEDIAHSL